MRYFDLSDDVSIPKRWHLGDVTTTGGAEPSLRAGLGWQGRDRIVTTLDRPGRQLDFCLTSFAVPVARTSLASAIEAIASRDVQRIPLSIPGHEGFEVLNVLRVIKCLDERRSEFTKWTATDHRSDLTGQYRMVTKLKLLPDAIPADAHIFRIEGWLVALIVSEPVKSAMEEAGCFGRSSWKSRADRPRVGEHMHSSLANGRAVTRKASQAACIGLVIAHRGMQAEADETPGDSIMMGNERAARPYANGFRTITVPYIRPSWKSSDNSSSSP